MQVVSARLNAVMLICARIDHDVLRLINPFPVLVAGYPLSSNTQFQLTSNTQNSLPTPRRNSLQAQNTVSASEARQFQELP